MSLKNETDLKTFYEAHYRASVRQAFRIVNKLHEAEDIVQECMIKLWDKRLEIANKENLTTYFRKMVRNKSIGPFKKKDTCQ